MAMVLKTEKYNISGMDCADCALTLEKGVAALPGVTAAQVVFSSATMEVQGDFDEAAVAERVRKLGYAITEPALGVNVETPPQRGGIYALGRYFLSSRPTRLALIAAGLLALSVPLSLWGQAAWMRSLVTGLHLSIVILAGLPIASRGVRSLFLARKVTIDLLMSIATLGALLIGETGEAATVIILFTVGETLEGFTAERARDSLRSLLSLRPARATVLRPCMDCAEHMGQIIPDRGDPISSIQETQPIVAGLPYDNHLEAGRPYNGGPCPFCGNHEVEVPVEQVAVGERVLVRPGGHIPVDGRVLEGRSGVNQAPVTGESLPVAAGPGDNVLAGTINGEAALEIEVTQAAANSAISKIVRLVEQAQSQRAPVERFVDRFAVIYTPAVVAIAILFAVVPPVFFGGSFFDTDGTRGWLYRALALLIVACPCALVISTPVTMVSALTGLARRGVLVKGGQFLDALSRVKTFAFDKTGTLTRGMPVVRMTWTPACPPGSERCAACDDMLALAATVERRSGHPLAQAILAEVDDRHLNHVYPSAEAVVSLSSQGIQGLSNGVAITVGSHSLFHEQNGDCGELHDQVLAAETEGQTVMLVGRGGAQLGFVGVADVLREDSTQALQALKAMDPALKTVMLTGDNPAVAQTIASRVGVVDEIQAGLLPEDKLEAVRDLQRRYGAVAMVGDGVNDAPALAAAEVGIAMGGAGTAQAMETADMVLMQDNLTRLPEAVLLSRKAMGIIRQNITFSLAIKAVFLLLTIPGWATLWMAVFADMGASLLVTANGMRARR
jgi:Cd2+/Zn2+-exporting ATPase